MFQGEGKYPFRPFIHAIFQYILGVEWTERITDHKSGFYNVGQLYVANHPHYKKSAWTSLVTTYDFDGFSINLRCKANEYCYPENASDNFYAPIGDDNPLPFPMPFAYSPSFWD